MTSQDLPPHYSRHDYRIVKQECLIEDELHTTYLVLEVFYDDKNKAQAYIEMPRPINSKSREGIREEILEIVKSLSLPVLEFGSLKSIEDPIE